MKNHFMNSHSKHHFNKTKDWGFTRAPEAVLTSKPQSSRQSFRAHIEGFRAHNEGFRDHDEGFRAHVEGFRTLVLLVEPERSSHSAKTEAFLASQYSSSCSDSRQEITLFLAQILQEWQTLSKTLENSLNRSVQRTPMFGWVFASEKYSKKIYITVYQIHLHWRELKRVSLQYLVIFIVFDL